MAYLLVEKGNASDVGKTFSFEEKKVIIGRQAPGNNPDIVLHDSFVSRHHAEICFHDNCYSLRDLGSTNGTVIDGTRIESGKFYPLNDGSVVGLGIAATGVRVAMKFAKSHSLSTDRIENLETTISVPLDWIKIDEKRKVMFIDNTLVSLSKKEYALLVYLFHEAGRLCSKEEIINEVWPEAIDHSGISDAAVDQLIHRVRVKIEPVSSHAKRLIVKKGFGYMLL
jgi:hypothetical protein